MLWKDISPVQTDRLSSAVKNAYSVFGKYRIGDAIVYCDCGGCMRAEDARKLISLSLEDISSELLAEYTEAAYHEEHGNSEQELKYFLPRYFDLIAQCEPPDNSDGDMCLDRLGGLDYRKKWPAPEVEAIDEFFDAFLEASLNQLKLVKWSGGQYLQFDMSAVLSMMMAGGGDVNRILETFESAADPAAAIHMAGLRANVTYKNGVVQVDIDDMNPDKFAEWLGRDAVTKRIIAAIDLIDDPNYDDVLEFGI